MDKEEIAPEVDETVVDENGEGGQDLSPEEKRALDSGWRPEDEWEGDPETWVDAKTFNMRGELMDRIKSQTSQLRGQDKKIETLQKSIKALADHNKRMDEIAFKKAMNELKSLKREAFETSDYEKLEEVEEQMEELKNSQAQTLEFEEETDVNAPHPEVQDWVEKNSWYTENTLLRGAADAMASQLVKDNPELKDSPAVLLEKVTAQIKSEFPEKFGSSRRKPSQTVAEPGEGAARAKSGTKRYTARHLNPTQLEVGRTFVEAGAMKDLAEYATQLAEIGELDIQKKG